MPPRGQGKSTNNKRSRSEDRDDYVSDDGFIEDGARENKSKAKKARVKGNAGSKDDGEQQMWEISNKRRVTVGYFKGEMLIGIREYYSKDGEMLPGAKGISLPIEQFNQFLAVLPEVEAALIAKGQTVQRPIYDGEQVVSTKAAENDGAKGDAEDGAGSKTRKSEKQNFEATSEEEE